MMTNNENIQRKKLKEQGHTPSYIEWMIWKTKNNVPEGIVERRTEREILYRSGMKDCQGP